MISWLKVDKILVKNQEAIQKGAYVTDICVSKTGVLTKGEGTVTQYHLTGETEIMENRPEENG
jgi:cation transport ATPase